MPQQSVIMMDLLTQTEFLNRIQFNMIKTAGDILNESNETAHHLDRVNYARNLILSAESFSRQAAAVLVTLGNIIANTTWDEVEQRAVCSATDGDIFSQCNFSWNVLAGIAAE